MMKLLRDGGLSVNNLDVIFSSLIVNQIAYSMPVCAGFLTMEQVVLTQCSSERSGIV